MGQRAAAATHLGHAAARRPWRGPHRVRPGSTTKGSGSVTLTRKSAQAGKAGKVCFGRYGSKSKQTCKTVTWAVGRKIALNGSITTPAAIHGGARQGFGVSAYVGQIYVGGGASVYQKTSRGHVVPDTNESACGASAGAHAAC